MEQSEILTKIKTLREALTEWHFPRWEDFPEVNLYMDQVTELVNRYFAEASRFFGSELVITPSMINNYVKSKSMPAPVKKKYSRLHLAYIMIIGTLKQTFSLSVIQSLFAGSGEEDIKELYNAFAQEQETACANAITEIEQLLKLGNTALSLKLISSANLTRSITLRIIDASEKAEKSTEN